MDRAFQVSTLWQKVRLTRSANPTIVCNGISDIESILVLLSIDDDDLLEPLHTAFDVADVALGFGETQLEGPHAMQVQNLLDDFTNKLKRRI